MLEAIQFELTEEYRDRFEEALEQKDEAFIQTTLEGVNPADITALLHEFGTEDSK